MRPLPHTSELEAIEFPALAALVARGARTRAARKALGAMHPWDGLGGLRRLRQLELGPLWTLDPGALPVQPFDEAQDELMNPAALPIVPFDEALDEVLNPAGWPQPEHWRQLREGLRALAVLLRNVRGLAWPEDLAAPEGTELGIDRLQVTADLLPDPAPVADRLGRCFTEDGQLDPLRVPGLAELHRARQRCFQNVQTRLQKLLRDFPDAFQEYNVVERNGRFCLPVRTERRGMVPGLVLDRSSSGATVFVEPFEAVSLNNDHVEADREYTQAVQAFLRELLDDLRGRRFDFERWHRFQADADEALALLRWAALCDGILPDLGQDRLRLLDARHPLLLPGVRAALDLEPLGHDPVPLTLELDRERPGVVISGSNTGGKTVVLKTVGLLTALARAGCAIPARTGTEVPELATLHADIGDHQTLVGSLSTFSSHILHLKRIIAQARRGGLVLLDELGTGTDPKEGAALGIALLQALSRRQCWVLCSTHLGEISQWALRHPKFQNASVQFDEERLAPTYRLMVGMPGQSRALTIAAKLGLPAFILEHAEKVLGQREQDWREFLRQLEADRLRQSSIRASAQVREMAADGGSAEFLGSLHGSVTLAWRVDSADKRPLELINKTNQFNLNGHRIGEAEWQRLLEKSDTILTVASYQDKFGPLGKIAVLLGSQLGSKVSVSHWVMSCRAFSRRIEHHTLDALFRRSNAPEIEFAFEATERNQPLQEFFQALGISRDAEGGYRISRSDFLDRCGALPHEVSNLTE